MVLLHGFPECAYSWRHQLPPLVAAGFRVIVPDQRGYNRSDKPRGIAQYTVAKLAGDVIGLLDALGVARAHIVGHDWGGAVAWTTASLFPARVERMVVMNGPHPSHARREILLNPAQLRRSYYMFLFQLPYLAEKMLLRPGFIARAFRGTAVQKSAFSDEDLAVYSAAIQQPGAATAILSWYRASMQLGLPKLPQVLARSLCIWGDGDLALGPRMAQHLDRYAREIEVQHIADAGHWVQQEQPEQVNTHLLEFLQR